MKNLTPSMQTHVQGQLLTLCTCWHVIRQDGVEFGFTDHDEDLIVDSLTYASATGFTATAVESKADLSVDNMDLDGVLTSSDITETDILTGKYDYAEVEIFMVNYEDLAAGKIYVKRGRMGEVRTVRGKFTAEMRSLSQQLQQKLGEVYTPSCSAVLGDARCKKALGAFTVNTTVSSASDRQKFKATALTQAAGYFTGGELVFTSGDNLGLRIEVKEFSATQITLALPMPNSVDIGDAFTIIAGCDKTSATCKAKFANLINFRGFPDIPGLDAMLETAGTADLRY